MRNKENLNFLVVADPEVGRILNKLRKGMVIKSRIVFKIAEGHYALRLFGRNLLMESGLYFERFDEIFIQVQKIRPKLVLKLVGLNKADFRKKLNGRMNIIV